MKNVLLAASLLLGMAAQAHAELMGDTLVIEDAKKVRIETRDTVQRIVINGAKDDVYFHYTQRISIPDTTAVRRKIKSVKDLNKVPLLKKRESAKKGFSGAGYLNIGLGTMTGAPADFKFKLWPSFDLGIGLLGEYRPYGKKNVWSIGLGVNWRSYRSDKATYWKKEANDVMALSPYTAEQTETSTQLNIFSVQMPVMYTHYFDGECDWGITLGAMLNLNTGGHAMSKFTYAEDEYEVKTKAIQQRLFTVDGMVVLHNPVVDVYCKYSPMKFFKTGKGPEMHQISFGIYL